MCNVPKTMSTNKSTYSVLPYSCISIDAEFKDFKTAVQRSLTCPQNSSELSEKLIKIWTAHFSNYIFPCLSVRSCIDLYLDYKKFPPGSEVIMSAINIPSMVQIVRYHKLRVVPLDVSIESTAPKLELLESLITSRTVAILVAHLYGKRSPMEQIIRTAQKHEIPVIEDCAESFDGFQNLSHPDTDLALFSFGVIKYFTSFGGAMAVVKNKSEYEGMLQKQSTYPVQARMTYLKKVLKYYALYFALDSSRFVHIAINILRSTGVDYQNVVIKLLRGFPDELIANIRHQPSSSLLSMMLHRQSNMNPNHLMLQRMKGEYVASRLPPELVTVGQHSDINNYWLFPILVENPDTYVATIKALGIEAYRGASQLNLVEPDNVSNDDESLSEMEREAERTRSLYYYPHEAKYLIDHVVYLPVNKHVPFPVLDHIIQMAKTALQLNKQTSLHKVRNMMPSKL